MRELVGTLGKSDLAGVLSIDLRGQRPLLEAEISSRTLDARDLAISRVPLSSHHLQGLLLCKVRTSRQMRSLSWNSPER